MITQAKSTFYYLYIMFSLFFTTFVTPSPIFIHTIRRIDSTIKFYNHKILDTDKNYLNFAVEKERNKY